MAGRVSPHVAREMVGCIDGMMKISEQGCRTYCADLVEMQGVVPKCLLGKGFTSQVFRQVEACQRQCEEYQRRDVKQI